MTAGRRRPRAAAPAQAAASARRMRPAALALLGPGIAWLVLFYVVPLAIIFLVSLGQRDPLDRVVYDPLSFDNYARAFDTRFLPTFLNSLRYASIDHDPVPGHRLSPGLLDLAATAAGARSCCSSS